MNDGTKALLAEARDGLAKLTAQERTAIGWVAEGLTNVAIGQEMGHTNARGADSLLRTANKKLWPDLPLSLYNPRVLTTLLLAGGSER